MLAGTCGFASPGALVFWCTSACMRARKHIGPDRALPESAFAAPPPVAPAPTIARIAAQATERLAIVDRVRPILSDAIHQAEGYEATALVTMLGVRIMTAILKGD